MFFSLVIMLSVIRSFCGTDLIEQNQNYVRELIFYTSIDV